MKLSNSLLRTAGALLIFISASRSLLLRAEILNSALDQMCFQPAEKQLLREANTIIGAYNEDPGNRSNQKKLRENSAWIADTRQCQNLPYSTRYFLYRRFSLVAIGQTAGTQSLLVDKFSQLAYLACRESSGRVVAHVAHEREREQRASRYGTSFSDMKYAISKLVELELDNPGKGYFDQSTNAGFLQISADFINDQSTQRKNRLYHWYADRIWDMEHMDRGDLALYCGNDDFFDEDLSGEAVSSVRHLGQRFRDRANGESLFRKNTTGMEDLVWFHQLQAICPGLHLDLAKEVLMLYGNEYFGPLNNSKNSESCGSVFHLCQKTFATIAESLNEKKSVIEKLAKE